jgi:hypothetical protein
MSNACFYLYSLFLFLLRVLSPILAQNTSDKELNRRSEKGKTLPIFNSIHNTQKAQKLWSIKMEVGSTMTRM